MATNRNATPGVRVLWIAAVIIGSRSCISLFSIQSFLDFNGGQLLSSQFNHAPHSSSLLGDHSGVDVVHRITTTTVMYTAPPPPVTRLRLNRHEFVVQKPSQIDVDSFFAFDLKQAQSKFVDSSRQTIEPLWTCALSVGSDARTFRKLQFIQIPTTGDLLLRTLLRAYAEKCQAGLVVVSHCVDLGFEFMPHTYQWVNGKGSARAGDVCTLSYTIERSSGRIVDDPLMVNQIAVSSSYVQEHADILAGHVSLGVDEYWYRPVLPGDRKNVTRKRVRVQPLVFLRHPLNKFVQDALVSMPALNATRPMDVISQSLFFLDGMLQQARGINTTSFFYFHEKYAPYLVTPRQKAWVENEGVMWTPRHRTNLAMRNLVESHALVGITERWTESLAMLAYLIDGDHKMSHLFKFVTSPQVLQTIVPIHTNDTNGTIRILEISSTLPALAEIVQLTNAVVNEIMQNESWHNLRSLVFEYLQYDVEIYNFARQLHEKQYHRFTQQMNSSDITLLNDRKVNYR